MSKWLRRRLIEWLFPGNNDDLIVVVYKGRALIPIDPELFESNVGN